MAMFRLEMRRNYGRRYGFLAMALVVVGSGCGLPLKDGNTVEDSDSPLELPAATDCPAPPSDADPQAVAAYDRVNAYREAAGLGCSTFSASAAAAAAAHCDYYTSNTGACVASPHREVPGCDKFTSERFPDRMKRASYSGTPAYEAMTYVGNGSVAVDKWVDSIWHRVPILSPWVGEGGYGRSGLCDTMDFGWAKSPDDEAPVVYPFAGETGVPRSWDGATESPTVPAPPSGWPSGYPIMIYAAHLKVSSHTLYDGDGNVVDHSFLSPDDPASMGILQNEFALYADAPLGKATTYRVVIEGRQEDEHVRLDWTFTTR